MSNKIKKFEDVMFSLRCKARRHAGNFSLIEYAENFGVETLLNYAWNARDELAKEREIELVGEIQKYSNIARSYLLLLDGLSNPESSLSLIIDENILKHISTIKQEIELVLNGEGDE